MVSKWLKVKCNFIHKKIKSSPGMGEKGAGIVEETADRQPTVSTAGRETGEGSGRKPGQAPEWDAGPGEKAPRWV